MSKKKSSSSLLIVALFVVVIIISVASLKGQGSTLELSPAWEDASISQLLANPAYYSGHLVRANGYIVECTAGVGGTSFPFGCPKYSLYEATHEVAMVTPEDPHIALSWSGTVDPLVSFVQLQYDGQRIIPPGLEPRRVWVIATFTDRGNIMDAPRYVLIVSDVFWLGTTPTIHGCPAGWVLDANGNCVQVCPISVTGPLGIGNNGWFSVMISTESSYLLDFSHSTSSPQASDVGKVIYVSGTINMVAGCAAPPGPCLGGPAIIVQNWYFASVVSYTTQSSWMTTVTYTTGSVITTVITGATSTQYESCASMSARGGCGTCQDEQGRLISLECPIGPQFPNPPQSLGDVPRFLSQFWNWVSCRFFGHCS